MTGRPSSDQSGAAIIARLALRQSESLIAYHTTEPAIPWPNLDDADVPLSDAEREFLAFARDWEAADSGYAAIQRTRPQTLAYRLNDSPVAGRRRRSPSQRGSSTGGTPGANPTTGSRTAPSSRT